jgi:2-keto-4-pentenoate hydratase
MLKNGDFVEAGSGKNSLRSPALCLAELGSTILRRRPTEPLAPGEIIRTGTLTGGHLTEKDDLWTADVTGLAVPTLTLRLN